MKVLIVGATGMLGHVLFDLARSKSDLDVWGTVKRRSKHILTYLNADPRRIFKCDLASNEMIDQDLFCAPDVVINCAGVVRHLHPEHSSSYLVRVNALAPHILAEYCDCRGARLIQLSTDCVFSGRKGKYFESDIPDPSDAHGKMKSLGEIDYSPHLTIRTSFIGHEILREYRYFLLDWFLAQTGEVGGYTRAFWSGLTTLEISRIIIELIQKQEVDGILHVCGETLSKFELLCKIQSVFNKKDVVVRPDDSFVSDRSLRSSRLDALGIEVPNIQHMLVELRDYYQKRLNL